MAFFGGESEEGETFKNLIFFVPNRLTVLNIFFITCPQNLATELVLDPFL